MRSATTLMCSKLMRIYLVANSIREWCHWIMVPIHLIPIPQILKRFGANVLTVIPMCRPKVLLESSEQSKSLSSFLSGGGGIIRHLNLLTDFFFNYGWSAARVARTIASRFVPTSTSSAALLMFPVDTKSSRCGRLMTK